MLAECDGSAYLAVVSEQDFAIRCWDVQAISLLDALAGDPWLDFARRAPTGGLFEARGRETYVAWKLSQPLGLIVLDVSALGVEMTIAVDPRWRRRGVARRLVLFGRQRARDHAGECWVLVDRVNVVAMNFFRELGFREMGGGAAGHVRFVA